MDQQKRVFILLIAGLTGFITAVVVTLTLYADHLRSFLDWGIALSLLTLGIGSIHALFLPPAWERFAGAPPPVRIWVMILLAGSVLAAGFQFELPVVVALIPAAFVLISPGVTAFQEFIQQGRARWFIVANVSSAMTSLFLLWLFQIFYVSPWEFVLSLVLLNLILTPLFDILLEQVRTSGHGKSKINLVTFAGTGLGIVLILLSIRLLLDHPQLFPPDLLMAGQAPIAVYFWLTILCQSWSALLSRSLHATGSQSVAPVRWVRDNLPGLVLALSISASTYLLATALVREGFGFIDNYFDTDSPLWLNYLTAPVDQIVELRAVHPFALMILRPPVWLISTILPVDTFHGALIFNSLAGGACVFLAWWFFKQRTGDTAYALLMAALLGFSNSHLILSIFLESYIFSAAMLLAFTVLLQVKDSRFSHLVSVGLLTFGITITNFIQTCLGLLLVRRSFRELSRFVFIVLSAAVLLAFAQNILFPLSDPFYIPKNLTDESAYQYDVLGSPPGLTLERAKALTRNILIISTVAPDPIILREDSGCTMPCFNTLLDFGDRYQPATYSGTGTWLVRFWYFMLTVAGSIFIVNLIKSPANTSLQAALAVNLMFNFALHMNYGDDPLLYSPNWTYALVLFFGISFEQPGQKKWFQVILLGFAAALLLNNMAAIDKVFEAVGPYSR